jgi:hypothetical protein
MNLNEVDKPNVKNIVVVYSGRFQPFHRGHYDAYNRLVSKFGSGNVYIGTSDDQSGPKSPFGFKEKKEIATKMFGIPSSKFVKINNPYKPVEILKKFDGQTTQYIAAVGEKDATRLQGNYFKPYKGKAGYGYDEIGYVYPVPAEANPISGTDVRNGLGSNDKEKAKKFFLKAYPKFDKDIFKMITDKLKKLNEDGFPGGIGTGLVLPGGYINGAPTGSVDETNNTLPSSKMRPEPHPTRHETEHPSDEPDWHKKNEPYDPISELLGRVAAEGIFEDFIKEYFDEAENKALDVDISYTNTKGEKKKIKARDALRLPKEHPAHIQAAKIAGPKNEPVTEPKQEPGKAATQAAKPPQPGQPVKKAQTQQAKSDKTPATPTAGAEQGPPPAQKLSGAELKSSAEKAPEDKNSTKVKQTLDSARSELSKEDNETIDKVNNPESPERKSMVDNVKNGFKKFGNGLKNWGKHKAEMVGGTMDAVKSLATTGKIGSVKDKDGKSRNWSEFTSVGRGGGHAYQENEVDVLDNHGHPTGKKKVEKKPIWRDGLNEEEQRLAEASWNERKKQVKHLKHFATDAALLVGSMALGGAGVAVAKSVMAGKAALAGHAALHGAAGVFSHGASGFAAHLGKDIAKHATLEAFGLGGVHAAGGGALLSTATAGLLEITNDEEGTDSNKFISNFFGKVVEKMETYKLSDEQLLKSIEEYKKDKPKQDAADLLRESISETKQQTIQNFIEYVTKRLNLKKTPKVTLLSGQEYSNNQSSLGGYNPETKEIYVQTENRLGADILRTIAHEMVHRKQDEMGLVKNAMEAGKDGSPVENQAHAVAGILMREYGRINKQIYTETIKKVGDKYVVYPKNGGDRLGTHDSLASAKKQLAAIEINKEVVNKKNLNNINLKLNNISLKKFQTIPTFKNLLYSDQSKNLKLGDNKLVVNNTVLGVLQRMEGPGNYQIEKLKEDINLDVDKGDTVLMGKFKNKKVQVKDIGKDDYGMPTINGKKATTFRLGPKAGEAMNEMGRNDIHLKNLMKKYRDASFRKRINAYFFGKPNMNNPSEVAKRLIAMNYDEITQMEKKLNIHNPDLDETINGTHIKILKEGLLLEGGAYGHMSHPFDDMDLTFGDLKNIISNALEGELGVTREKTDGQALAISWKNGRLIAARNKGNLANAGANAMGIEGVASKFAGRGGLTDAYNFAMRDLSAAIGGLSQKQKEKIFGEGTKFMNIEVIWPTSVNVIPYGQALLVFHNCIEYDEKGNAIGKVDGAESMLAGMIKQINANVQSKYTIQGPPITSIPKNENLSSKKGAYLSKLAKLQNQFGCADSDTMAVYHQHWWENFIDKNSPAKVDKITKDALIRRWAFGDKSFRLNTISNKVVQEWAMNSDKVDVQKKQKDNIRPFEEIFLGVGADVLQFVGSVLTVHPDKAIRAMKDKLKSVAQQVRTAGNPAQIAKLKSELTRLNQLGGIDKIVANEGLVFFYNGKTYKLTGTFAPLNQILGIFYE